MKKLLTVFFLIYSVISSAANVEIESHSDVVINKVEITEDKIYLLELEAVNPLDKTVQGGITVSFSADVEVKDNEDIQSGKTKIYPKGSEVYGAGHICCIKTEKMMVEKWYKAWSANAKQVMNLEFSVQDIDALKIYARASFIEDLEKKKVVNIPKDFDQQNYLAYDLAHVKSMFVKASPEDEDVVKNSLSTSTPSEEDELSIDELKRLEDSLPEYEKPLSPIDISFRVRPIIGISYFSHLSPLLTDKYSDYSPFLGIGLSATFANFSFDGYVQRTDHSIDHLFTQSNLTNENSRFRRTDYAFTVGYSYKFKQNSKWFTDHELSGFSGYKWGETSIANVAAILGRQSIGVAEIDSDTAGLFIGAGYIFPLLSKHKLGLYYSYGLLKPKSYYYKYTENGSTNFLFEDNINLEDSDAEAHKFGLYINGVIDRFSYFKKSKLTYRLVFDWYQYTIGAPPAERNSQGVIVPTVPIEEEIYSIGASLNLTFD